MILISTIVLCMLSLCPLNANCKTTDPSPETDSITGLSVYNYYDLDEPPIYIVDAENDSIRATPDCSIDNFMINLIRSTDATNASFWDIIPKIDIEFIITEYGKLTGERFVGKDQSELNSFQSAVLDNLKRHNQWIPGMINGQKVNTKIRAVIRVSPNH